MEIPPPDELIARVRSLAPGAVLLERLRGQTGVHLVGGAVRDLLRGGAPPDLDLLVEGDARELAESLGGEIVRYERFGTSTVRINGHSYDIAQSRRETYSQPGALPDVGPAALEEDLLRRDFTVNAIAISLGDPEPGALSAAPHALDDLEHRRLRVLHDASFLDDPTRLLRLARYRSRLGFEIEPATARLATEAVEGDAMGTVSGSRIGAELRLLAREPEPLAALNALHELGLGNAIHPEFGPADAELGRRALEILPDDGRPDRLVLALALIRLDASELRTLLDRLAFEAEDREVITATVSTAPNLAAVLSRAEYPSEILAAAGGLPPELVALAGALGPAEAATTWLEQLRHVGLQIDGTDLLAAGVPQGPAIGRGLRAALGAKLDGRAEGPEAELRAALEAAGAAG